MSTILDDLDGHEGYGARRLPDGSLTATWSATARFDAYVAACSCGWLGGEHPADDDGDDAAVDEWEAEHARPLLATAVPTEVTDAISAARKAVVRLAGERPDAARRALEGIRRWTDGLDVDADPSAPDGCGHGQPVRRPPCRRRALGR